MPNDWVPRFNSNCRLALLTMRKRFPNRARKEIGPQATWATIQSNAERICRGRLAPREAPRGEALDVCVLQRDLQNLHIEKAEIGKKLLSEINDEDINLWKLEIEGKRTPQKKPLSNSAQEYESWRALPDFRLAKRRGLANDKLLIDARPFKNEERTRLTRLPRMRLRVF